jgi:hypothetical protein
MLFDHAMRLPPQVYIRL